MCDPVPALDHSAKYASLIRNDPTWARPDSGRVWDGVGIMWDQL